MTSDIQNITRKEHYNTVRKIGRIVFRPLEARFVENTDKFGNMDPYCKIKLGHHKGKSSVAKNQGKHPIWAGDIITLKRKHDEMYAYLKVKDRDRFKIDDSLGKTVIPLEEIVAKGAVTQWYTLYKKKKVFGEILIAIEFEPKHQE